MITSARHPRLPGEVGIWAFVLGDLLVFTLFFSTYLHYRGEASVDYAAAQVHLNLALGSSNTLVLLTSSWLLASGIEMLQGGRASHARKMLSMSVLLGGAFVATKVSEYASIATRDFDDGAAEFLMFYFVLTGIHLVHVLVGLVVVAAFTRMIRAATSSPRFLRGIESAAIYWHMVDLLWIVLFTLFYLLR